jgi:hypothetical protein
MMSNIAKLMYANPRVLVRAAATVLALSAGLATVLGQEEERNLPIEQTHSVRDAPAPVPNAVFGSGPALHPGDRICTTATQFTANVDTDCEKTGPSNETSIAVNPTDENNIIGGANDYQLAVNPGGQVSQSIHSRAHVTFDGGRTWSEYPITFGGTYQATGDPAVAFDAAGRAYYATVGFRFVGPTNVLNPDVLVANSTDGGQTWTSVRVAEGSGNFGSMGDTLDKEYIAAWGNGNAIVTYGNFRSSPHDVSVRIYSSVTHDGGATWSKPQIISGDLDQAFVSIPTVAADGHIYVAFLNTTNLQNGRDDYEVVEVSPSTGARVFGPVKVATVIDGITDYPIAFGRQTYKDSLFRSWAAGNITADPTNAAHLAVIWSDMRNSTLPAPANPYAATTNSDVIVSQSFDRGRTWSTTPVALPLVGDQFQPWGAYDRTGLLRIGLFDRQYDALNHQYGYSLATETGAGTLTFTTTQLTTELSEPTKDNRWFAATLNPAFPFATAFIGDFSNIAAKPSGGIVAYWTDLRLQACFGVRCGHGQDAFFATAP